MKAQGIAVSSGKHEQSGRLSKLGMFNLEKTERYQLIRS